MLNFVVCLESLQSGIASLLFVKNAEKTFKLKDRFGLKSGFIGG